jgi:hypothetical protein
MLNTWGGIREGSGRPCISWDDKRVFLSTTVNPSTKAFLVQERRRNRLTLGRILDAMVEAVQEIRLQR